MPARRWIAACAAAPAIVAAAVALSRPSFTTSIDRDVYDTLVRSIPVKPADPRVAIVNVDERSLAAHGQWPWRRDVIARLIDRLRGYGATVIALDIVFPEPDRSAGADRALAEELRRGQVVLGYGMLFDDAPTRRECALQPANLALVQRGIGADIAPFFHATDAVCSLPVLSRASAHSGFMNAAPDPDGILRRAPLLMELDGRIYSSLALTAVRNLVGARGMTLQISNVNGGTLAVGDLNVPLDGRSNLLLRYRGRKKTFPYLSAADVFAGTAARDALAGKIVFVGTDALGTREVVSTPLDTLFAGVEVQATVADNLLQGDFFARPEFGSAVEGMAAIIAAGSLAVLVLRVGLGWGAAAAGFALILLWAGAGWVLSASGIFVSPLYATAAVLAGLSAITLEGFAFARQRAESAGEEKTNAQKLMVQTLLSLTETRDLDTGRHSRRTRAYTRLLADALARQTQFRPLLPPARIELLASLAPLHDIGKVGVPDAILNKRGPLTADELAEMRRHPVYGRDVIVKAEKEVAIRDDAILALAKDIVYTHHERWDGTGYPEGLRGTDIPIAGRILAIVDVYDAVTSRDTYAKPRTHAEAVDLIASGRGKHFDPAVVDAFLDVAPAFEQWARQSHEDPAYA